MLVTGGVRPGPLEAGLEEMAVAFGAGTPAYSGDQRTDPQSSVLIATGVRIQRVTSRHSP